MSAYTARPEAWWAPKGRKYVTLVPLRWEIGAEGSDLWLTVPAGFVFDVSIPRGLGWLADPDDRRYLAAAALHDWCLLDGWDRWAAGSVFRAALEADGVSRTRRAAMTLATIAGHPRSWFN